MRQVVGTMRVAEVQVVAVRRERRGVDLPGVLVLDPADSITATPPSLDVGEFLETQRLCLRVVLPPLRKGLLVEPDVLRGPAVLEEEQVGGDEGVGPKTPLGSRTTVCRLKSVSSFFLIRAGAPSLAKRTPLGTTIPHRPFLFSCLLYTSDAADDL